MCVGRFFHDRWAQRFAEKICKTQTNKCVQNLPLLRSLFCTFGGEKKGFLYTLPLTKKEVAMATRMWWQNMSTQEEKAERHMLQVFNSSSLSEPFVLLTNNCFAFRIQWMWRSEEEENRRKTAVYPNILFGLQFCCDSVKSLLIDYGCSWY